MRRISAAGLTVVALTLPWASLTAASSIDPLELAVELTALGPRPPGSAAHSAAAEILLRELRELDLDGIVRAASDEPDAADSLLQEVLVLQRERESLLEQVNRKEGARLDLPLWLIRHLRTDFPDQAEEIANGLAQRPPMALRVNTSRNGREAYLERLTEAGITARPSTARTTCPARPAI